MQRQIMIGNSTIKNTMLRINSINFKSWNDSKSFIVSPVSMFTVTHFQKPQILEQVLQ